MRSLKMLDAFKNCGCEIMLLEGENSLHNLGDRENNVQAMRERLKKEKPDACYLESPAGMIFSRKDRLLLREIHDMKIPISIFYGDAFWKFPEFSGVQQKKRIKQRLRDFIIHSFQRSDWRLFSHIASNIYFPSASMTEHFEFPSKKVSYPGCFSAQDMPRENNEKCMRGIYVGGATYRYGAHLLLDAFEEVNSTGLSLNLSFICKEEAWKEMPEKYQAFEEKEWFTRFVASGDSELATLYANADFACLPLTRNTYNDFAMPIKLFEYLSYRKPIIATDCTEQAAFILDNQIGIVSRDTPGEYAAALKLFIAMTSEERARLVDNMDAIYGDNTWDHRAQEILDDFPDSSCFT